MEMKKNLRKAVISFLAVSTAFSGALVTASLAAPDNNLITSVSAKEQGHITINANVGDNGVTQSLAGKKFNVYKIFDAENSAGMESINYTMNPAYEKALKKVTGKDTEYSIIDYIQTMNNNTVINNVEAPQLNESRYSNFRYFIEDLRNEIVAEKAATAEQHDAQHRHGNGNAGERGHPPVGCQVVAPVRQHHAPRHGRRLNAKPQEAQRCLNKDAGGHAQRGHHDESGQNVRQNVAHHNHAARGADGAGRLHIFLVFQPQHLAAHHARIERPVCNTNHEHQRQHAGVHNGKHHHGKQSERDRVKRIGDAHNHRVNPAAKIAGQNAHHRADEAGHHHGENAHQKRHAGANQNAREDASPQNMVHRAALCPARRLCHVQQVNFLRRAGDDEIGKDGDKHHHQHNDKPQHAGRAFQQKAGKVKYDGALARLLFCFRNYFCLFCHKSFPSSQ